jgi:hypothetical protein
MTCTLYDEFAGFGGSSQGAAAVPGVELMLAANHKGRPALDGVVENVVQVRKLDEFGRWRREIEAEVTAPAWSRLSTCLAPTGLLKMSVPVANIRPT